ncbi:MAG: PQQ-binding-like beta-propeller repeat protein [Planctomycetota bacterium]|jgi:hypothetical protein|nr:PQQ-binding-like beta-propeller repeat protein [Planctomycetota bacterium]
MKHLLTLAITATLYTPALLAQSEANLLWTANGENSHDAIGHKLHATLDLNGDGTRDFFSINAWADTNGLNNNGLIQAHSGLDGSVIWSHAGTQNGDGLGRILRLPGDVNSDGANDIFIINFDASTNGHIENGFVRALSGANGNVLWQRDGTSNYEWYGYRNSLMEDINGDGVSDFLIASPEASSNGLSANGYVAAIDVVDGSTVWRVDGALSGERVGSGFLYARQMDGNGYRDVVVSNSTAGTNGFFQNGYVMALAGNDGSQMWRVDGASHNRKLGQDLHVINDIDSDGFKDLVVSDPTGSTGIFFENGAVTAFSGASGTSLWENSGANFLQRYGAAVEFSRDINGDGMDDLLLGSPDDSLNGLTNNGSVQAVDGTTGAAIWTRSGTVTGDRFGNSLSIVGDVNGDGFADVLTATPEASVGGKIENGSVAMISSSTGNIIWRREGANSGHQLGYNVALPSEESLRDLSGDGIADVILGTPLADLGGFFNNGEIEVVLGHSGSTLWSVSGTESDVRLGDILDVEDDLDGDGVIDLLSASRYSDVAGYSNNGSIFAFGGADGTELWMHPGGANDEYFGNARGTIIAFDVDGDGHNEVLAGTPLANVDGLVDNGYVVCISSGMSMPLDSTPLVAGQNATLTLSNVEPGSVSTFLSSLAGPAHNHIGQTQIWVGLANPRRLATIGGSLTQVNYTTMVPAGLSGYTVWLQAVSNPGHEIRVSPLLVREIQ